MTRILVVTPKLPWPATGADEQDRAFGIGLLKDLGYEIWILAKTLPHQSENDRALFSEHFGVPVDAVPYTQGGFSWKRFTRPVWLDGAAFEYTDPRMHLALTKAITDWHPSAVWFDSTSSWPLFAIPKRLGVPVITRSMNIESLYFLEEEGKSVSNYLKYLAKTMSEQIAVKESDHLFALTPREEKGYRERFHAQKISVLPLRHLPTIIAEPPHLPRDTRVINVLFLGASYSIEHNLRSAEFIIKTLAPKILSVAPGKFTFHITGKKLPQHLIHLCKNGIVYEGYVEDIGSFMKNMDICLSPSLSKHGMQGKVFEPIVRGIPTITSVEGVAGYPFEDDRHVLFAHTLKEWEGAILSLVDYQKRVVLSRNARALSEKLFSKEVLLESLRKECTPLHI